MWTGIIVATFGEVVADLSTVYKLYIKKWVFYGLYTIIASGLAGFQSNIVQLGIDQLTDSSATEISSFIMWYTLTFYASGFTVYFISDCVVDKYKLFEIKMLFVALCLTLALCSEIFFRHWLLREHITGKSIRLILKVIRYTLSNSRLRYSFATENELPSRFDIAKHKYGGPFMAQQVDNVRKFLWMLPILASFGIVYGAITPLSYAKQKVERRFHDWLEARGITGCYENLSIHYSYAIYVIVFVVLYEFVIHPLFHTCIPKVRITSRFLLGTVLLFLWIMSLLGIEAVTYHRNNGVKCTFTTYFEIRISYKWLLTSGFLMGLSSFFLITSGLEFIWAQAPSTMKGLVLGLAYTFLGLGTSLHTLLLSPFALKMPVPVSWKHTKLSCRIWYFLIEGVIILLVLILLSVLIKRCKKKP